MYRQGDIALVPVARVHDLRGFTKHRETILAEGEVTGHHHRLRANRGRVLRHAPRRGGITRIHVPKSGAKLTHEEHDTIDVPAGDYQLVRQREYVAPTPQRAASSVRVFD